MRKLLHASVAITTLSVPSIAAADSTPLSIGQLQFETVHEVAERNILARDDANKPLVALLKLGNGDVLPPHGEDGGVRLLTVISGALSWGDGSELDPHEERIFGAGTLLVISAKNGAHWAAARNGDVLLQVVFVRDGILAPEAAAQLK